MNTELINLYNQNAELMKKNSSAGVNEIRESAFHQFQQMGLPDKSRENYRYINIDKLFQGEYAQNFEPPELNVDFTSLFRCNVPELDSYIILFVNGWYYDKNIKLKLPENVFIGSIKEMAEKHPEVISNYYAKIALPDDDGLVALNTAFTQDGLGVYIPKNTVIEKPIQIINVLIHDGDFMLQQRNLICCEENSQAKIVVCDHTLTPFKFLNNTVTEIIVKDNASLSIFNIQDQNNSSALINSVYTKVCENAHFTSNTATLHGGTIRNNLITLLEGKHSEANVSGIYLMDRKQHIDNYTLIDHAVEDCRSNQLFKGILDDEATGSFNGKILVRKNAQRTSAFQKNNNVLMNDNARMTSKPQLEIYADDVKCSHGATSGQINEDALFYLRSRGISEKEARLMIMEAFANEVIGKIDFLPLRERIEDLVSKRLRGELSRCSNCVVNCN